MSKYRITLDGKTYEMEVELIDEGKSVVPPPERRGQVLESLIFPLREHRRTFGHG